MINTRGFGRLAPVKLLGALGAFLCLTGVCPTQAQHADPIAPDSVVLAGEHVLPAVRVQAVPLSRFAVGSRVTSIDSATLAQYRSGTLTDVLAARTPLYIKNYGPGQLSSISFRGTSAQHTAVLWNGFNIGLPTLGQTDFSLLPVSGNARVEVQHGPASAAYGTAAIGGTVLLSSPVVWGAGPRASVQLDAGSFGLGAGSLEGSFSNQKIAVRTSATYREAQNDFPYYAREFRGLVRHRQQNAAIRQGSFAQDVTLRLGQASELMAAAWLTDANRQIQPAIGSSNNQAREHDQSRRLLAGYRHVASRHETDVRVAWFDDVLNYQQIGLVSNSRVQTTQLQADHTLNFAAKANFRLGIEAQHFAAQVDGYRGRKTENRYSGYALFRYDPRPEVRLTLNLRQAMVPNRRPPLAPTAGAEWNIYHIDNQLFTIKTSASRSYRAPTLNERYWPTGNPNILPEDGIGYEGGLRHEVSLTPQLALHSELTAYRQLVDNWVEWLSDPITGGSTPHNVRKVRAQGLEASTQAKWHPGAYALLARASYALTQSEKVRGYADDPNPMGQQLAYVPLHSAAFTTDHTWRGWQLTTSLTFTGERRTYSTATTLPSYVLLNATIGRTLHVAPTWSLTALAQGYNLTNRTYQNYEFRAMPPCWGLLSVRVAWH
ncbi:TonB-dependent receptor plug domain-containing protein [Hymenobacter sp. BT491]|uniref:TonB-dependent receptor plug domain-containing protein n=1 Tax=Hymenobacter sp. BT491 TaxID=2766779 RepID=UPI0016536201|nr:TonB-dependent receptor [Hymenobacter sp. BT491]MBC6990904.1 TonB-dependent receptor [Hymenobacter sp. BT491]